MVRHYGGKQEGDNLKKIEIRWLKKYSYLDGWKSGVIKWTSGWDGSESSIGIMGRVSEDDAYIKLTYTQTDQDGIKKDFDYKVYLARSPCNYGGVRYWFICPLSANGKPCDRKVGVLYKNGDYFGCRHCYNLTYASKNENRRYKNYYLFRILDTQTKVEKIRSTMKKSFYAGKPTRKMRRIMRLHQGSEPYVDTLMKREKRGIL